MADLFAQAFDANNLQLVANLDCGESDFGKIATKWIKCLDPDDSAAQSIADRQTQVYLFYDEATSELVGFGSLGETVHKIKKVPHKFSIIPHVGVDARFHHKPTGVDWEERYGAILMRQLMDEAFTSGNEALILFVDPANKAAVKLYRRLGFYDQGKVNKGYQKMVIFPK